ncbi:MAG: hypothetical protein KDD61_05015, partial [Bdellovibrionales bacterium]|nr:hypothetical protein [Bdellovibrionales bacterium]
MNEWNRLTEVLLYCPTRPFPDTPLPHEVLHFDAVNVSVLRKQWLAFKTILESLGVHVVVVEEDNESSQWNMLYCRDHFFRTPMGLVMGEMQHPLRKSESPFVRQALQRAVGPEFLFAVDWGSETIEGADVLWLRDDLVVVGTGHRTTLGAFNILKSHLKKIGVQVVAWPCSHRQCQHLLGVLQIIDRNLAAVRVDVADPFIVNGLKEIGYEILPVRETVAVARQQAMNWVCLGPREVLL